MDDECNEERTIWTGSSTGAAERSGISIFRNSFCGGVGSTGMGIPGTSVFVSVTGAVGVAGAGVAVAAEDGVAVAAGAGVAVAVGVGVAALVADGGVVVRAAVDGGVEALVIVLVLAGGGGTVLAAVGVAAAVDSLRVCWPPSGSGACFSSYSCKREIRLDFPPVLLSNSERRRTELCKLHTAQDRVSLPRV